MSDPINGVAEARFGVKGNAVRVNKAWTALKQHILMASMQNNDALMEKVAVHLETAVRGIKNDIGGVNG